jgi:hypothetical protein
VALRGIDLCGAEREGPFWLYRPLLMFLREKFDEVAAVDGTPTPGLTVHVGESFAHLLTGLRAVDEPHSVRCEQGKALARRGDRLGHCVALGWDPKDWARRHPVVQVRALDRLCDLWWIRERMAVLMLDLSAGDLRRIEAGIADAANRLGLSPAEGEALVKARAQLIASDIPRLQNLSSLRRDAEAGPRLKALFPLFDNDLLDGGPWLPVETARDVRMMDALSTALGRHLANLDVVVELNPSSNLLIGALNAPLDQPRFWQRGLHENAHGALAVCISADDPMAFATHLEDEVAYAWAGMVVAGGLSPAFARGWIQEALRVAWLGRFTRGVLG